MNRKLQSYYFIDNLLAENEKERWTPQIFDAKSLSEHVSTDFNAVAIKLDGTLQSDLNWQKETIAARKYIADGLRLFWEIDLGLFFKLALPLNDQSQYYALQLCLDHFRDTLWKEFNEHTIGLCLYRGPLNLNDIFRWDEEQVKNLQGWFQDHFRDETFNFQNLMGDSEGRKLLSLYCCDAAAEYLRLLAEGLPDQLQIFALFDVPENTDSLFLAQLLAKERFPRMIRGISEFSHTPKTLGYMGRDFFPPLEHKEIKVGVCLSSHFNSEELSTSTQVLSDYKIPFKIIPEEELTAEWDGLDYLLVHSKALSPQGQRKLRGFCAAGGTVILCDDENASLGLPLEESFSKWITTNL